jgi:hypothetical protein
MCSPSLTQGGINSLGNPWLEEKAFSRRSELAVLRLAERTPEPSSEGLTGTTVCNLS